MKQKLLILLLTLMGLTTTVSAVDYYDLWICGVQVSSENAADLSIISGITCNSSVKPYYKATNNTLYLQDCTLTSSTSSTIKCMTSSSFNVEIAGTVEITCNYPGGTSTIGSGIEATCHTFVRGSLGNTTNVLNVTSSGMGICVYSSSSSVVKEMSFMNKLEVTVDGAKGGITGRYYTSYDQRAKLLVGYGTSGTKIKVKGGYETNNQYYGSVTNFQSINLHPDYRISAPEDAYILTNSIYVHDGTYTPYKDWVTIEYDPTIAVIDESAFPDENFRNFILSQDYGADGILYESEVPAITTIDCQNLGIENLKGIECFTSLKTLYCQDNQLQALDVSKNKALVYLACQNNQLQTLDLHTNTSLNTIHCYNNPMTPDGIDNMILNLPYEGILGITYRLYVYDPDGVGVNLSKFHVGLATQKQWYVCRKDGVSWRGLESLRGDMNGDGELSVGDVTILVNKIVNQQ